MIRDMRIYTNKDIIMVEDIYVYHIYSKAKVLEIITQKDICKRYNLEEIVQIDILTRFESKSYANFVDTILF